MNKKRTGRRLIFILLGLAIVGLGIFLVINNRNQNRNNLADLQTVKVEKGELLAVVGATGTVRSNQSARVAWQTSGRIATIKVKVGDTVASNTILADLADSSLPQQVILAQADLVTAQRNLDNLINSNLNRAQAELNLANAKDTYDRARGSSLQSGTVRNTNQNSIDAARAAVTLAENKVKDAQDAYDRLSGMNDTDPLKAAALSTLANARQNLEQAKRNLAFLTGVPGSTELSISDAKVAVALAQYEDAQREWERQKDGPDPQDIAAAQARITATQATIDLAQISAPFGGTITEVSGMVGDLVNAGSAAFRIDDLSRLLVDVEVPEVDINRIRVGQDVSLSFDAIPDKTYQGRVSAVAQVGTVQAGLVNFEITLEILNPDEQVLPGMTAAVNITTDKLENVLTVPNRAVRLVDNKPVVYVLRNNVPTKVDIQIGVSSDVMSQVLSGDIKVGDTVVLNPPTNILDFRQGPPF